MSAPLAFTWSWPGTGPAPAGPAAVAVSGDPDGRRHVPLAVDADGPAPPAETGRAAGAGLGVSDFAVTSDGEKFPDPRHLERKARNLARCQRRLARCQKGSASRAKARAKVARAHRKVRDARKDFLHKAGTALVRGHGVIVVDDLSVSGMTRRPRPKPDGKGGGERNGAAARARRNGPVPGAGFGEFRRQPEYKARRYGRTLTGIDRWFPGGKMCPAGGHRPGKLSLAARHWPCPPCGTGHDRDMNAAKNILAAGLAAARGNPGGACGADVRHPGSSRVQSSVQQEPRRAATGIAVLQGGQ